MSTPNSLEIRPVRPADHDALWHILEPVIRAGETYPLPRDWSRDRALGYWLGPNHEVFVASEGGTILGTYYLRPNNLGGGAHIANCGYMVATNAQGRGVARTMCTHSLERARQRGFKGMQFNLVIASNQRAVKLWQAMGFQEVGRLPKVFDHPRLGMVDALVLFQSLE